MRSALVWLSALVSRHILLFLALIWCKRKGTYASDRHQSLKLVFPCWQIALRTIFRLFIDFGTFVAKFYVKIYALFPQIFCDWRVDSLNFFAFRKYAAGYNSFDLFPPLLVAPPVGQFWARSDLAVGHPPSLLLYLTPDKEKGKKIISRVCQKTKNISDHLALLVCFVTMISKNCPKKLDHSDQNWVTAATF